MNLIPSSIKVDFKKLLPAVDGKILYYFVTYFTAKQVFPTFDSPTKAILTLNSYNYVESWLSLILSIKL